MIMIMEGPIRGHISLRFQPMIMIQRPEVLVYRCNNESIVTLVKMVDINIFGFSLTVHHNIHYV